MRTGRIQAVDHVHLEAPVGSEPSLRWFYGELLDLAEMPPGEGVLRFRSERIELRIRLCSEPAIEAIDERVTVAVRSLRVVEDLLQERKTPYERFRGLDWTDRRLSLLDPAGNRVVIRRDWPSMAF